MDIVTLLMHGIVPATWLPDYDGRHQKRCRAVKGWPCFGYNTGAQKSTGSACETRLAIANVIRVGRMPVASRLWGLPAMIAVTQVAFGISEFAALVGISVPV